MLYNNMAFINNAHLGQETEMNTSPTLVSKCIPQSLAILMLAYESFFKQDGTQVNMLSDASANLILQDKIT